MRQRCNSTSGAASRIYGALVDELPVTEDLWWPMLPIAHDGRVCAECAAVAGVELPKI